MIANPVKNSILKYNGTKKNFKFLHKKNKFYIIDGYISYNINTTDLTCLCSAFLCEHLIYFLTNILCIDINNLIFFNKIKKELLEIFVSEKNTSIISKKINDFINSDCECIICMCPILYNKYNNIYMECSICYNFCHKYCYDIYKSKSGLLVNTCIYCKSGILS
jgi:hypothetical protein